MAPDSHPPAEHHAPTKPAVWPWLLVPVVALALFFTLRAVRSTPEVPAFSPGASASEAAVPASDAPPSSH